MPLLATPFTVTTTGPVVVASGGPGATMLLALPLVGVATPPLNRTVLVPSVEPKFAPVIVTEVPTSPEVGDRPETLGGTGLPDTNVVTVEGGKVAANRPADTAIGACGSTFSVAEVTQGVTVTAVVPFMLTPNGTVEPLSLMATMAIVPLAGSL